jgi:hypothetical protein
MFLGFIALVLLIAGLRKLVGRNKIIETGPTWGCGYQASSSKIQYTANSYVRSYAKLAKPVLDIEKHEVEVSEIFPSEKHYETHPYDKIEKVFIDKPLKQLNRFTDLFLFLQNGHLQRYILYGIVFITSVIVIPLLISKIEAILELLKSL